MRHFLFAVDFSFSHQLFLKGALSVQLQSAKNWQLVTSVATRILVLIRATVLSF